MVKRWRCTQCGKTTETGMVTSLQGNQPDPCEHCGNEEFDELQITGVLHRSIEDLRNILPF